MYVVLSQKIDTDSSYSDILFDVYHYPKKYKNQLHEGDVFVYYQGNRFVKEQRYYYGMGIVGPISYDGKDSFYAKLLQCKRFSKNIPIYLPDGGYVEQLGMSEKRDRPPWQSSIRPLSEEAYTYILRHAFIISNEEMPLDPVRALKEELKKAVKRFYVDDDISALSTIQTVAHTIEAALTQNEKQSGLNTPQDAMAAQGSQSSAKKLEDLVTYCKKMRMSFSYKPLLIIALIESGTNCLSVSQAAMFFRSYYSSRRAAGLDAEKKNCIYQNPGITDEEMVSNIIQNPVKALSASDYFIFDTTTQQFGFAEPYVEVLTPEVKKTIATICKEKQNEYYSD